MESPCKDRFWLPTSPSASDIESSKGTKASWSAGSLASTTRGRRSVPVLRSRTGARSPVTRLLTSAGK